MKVQINTECARTSVPVLWIFLFLTVLAFLQSCSDHDEDGAGLVSFAQSLPPEIVEEMNGELRDILARHGYPLAYADSVEIILTSEGLDKKGQTLLRLRSILPENISEDYAPILILGNNTFMPQDTGLVMKHGPFVEIEQLFAIPSRLLVHEQRVLIGSGRKTNVLISNVGIRRVREAAEIMTNSGDTGVLVIPVEL